MIRWTLSLTFLLMSFFIYLFYLSQIDTRVVPASLPGKSLSPYKTLRGVINVKTTRSNGSGHPTDVIEEAEAAGLNWMMFTDPKDEIVRPDLSGYRGQLLVLDAVETTSLDSTLYVATPGENPLPYGFSGLQLKLTELLSKKSPDPDHLMILSNHSLGYWPTEVPTGLHAVEVYNLKSIADEAWVRSRFSVVWSLLTMVANPDLAFLRVYADPTSSLWWWDQKSQMQRMLGFAGAEATARALPLPGWLVQFPSYQRSFEAMSNNIWMKSELTGNFVKDRQKIFQALQAGNFFMSLDLLGDSRGFLTELWQDSERHLPGFSGSLRRNTRIRAQLPAEPKNAFEMIVFRNGERVYTTNQTQFEFTVLTPGVYRVAVRTIVNLPFPEGKRWYTWITSNSFFIR